MELDGTEKRWRRTIIPQGRAPEQEGKKMNIKISAVDSRTLVEIDGENLPEIFSGYQLKSSNSGELELWLCVQGSVSVSELSAKIVK